MMQQLLVGDIGSSKSTWWLGGPPPREVHLAGYNPVQHDPGLGRDMLSLLSRQLGKEEPDVIWYYGSGITGPAIAAGVAALLQDHFPASTVHVHSDLLGAARAACGYAPGSVVILGTGSHAARYDGREITRQACSLGYILGDEGSGCDIGKALIRAYYYRQMPQPLSEAFSDLLPADRSGFLNTLAASPAPNQYLASFTRFAADRPGDPWLEEMIGARFDLFIRTHLAPLTPDGPVHVVGSVGCIFAALFEAGLRVAGLQPGQFIRDPARSLFLLHHQDGRHQH